MLSWDKTAVETLLGELDETGYLFPEFMLHKVNNQLQLLGKGGFSVIYEMRGKHNTQLEYVLKVIGLEKYSMTSEQFQETVKIQRFLCAKSPYVMRIIDAKELRILFDEAGKIQNIGFGLNMQPEDNELYLQVVLMEKLENIIIKDRFKRVTLTIDHLQKEDEIIEFALQIGEVLQSAHDNDILHRDIKLENIFWDKSEQCFKLGDFGIAKSVEGGNADTVVYTEGYGAPEIGRRLSDCYNATADIYSFGITLYLLLNELKFPGSDGYYSSKVQYDPQFIFPAPQNASEEMTRIIRKMCSFNKEDRYQSMTEVLMDLKHVREKSIVTENNTNSEVYDVPTETYQSEKEEKITKDNTSFEYQRTHRKKVTDILINKYSKINQYYFIILSVLMFFLLAGVHGDTKFVSQWQFWILPGMVLLEAILIHLKEFHIMFGCISIVGIIYSMILLGMSVPHLLLLATTIIGIPVVTSAGAIAVIMWSLLAFYQKLNWCSFLWKYHLTWIITVIILIVAVRYIYIRNAIRKECTLNKQHEKEKAEDDYELDK